MLTRDELLDNVMLYWLPGTGASSGRLYWESFNDFTTKLGKVDGPGRRARCSPRRSSARRAAGPRRRFSDIRQWNELDQGGHFAAFEQPEAFVDEVRSFFRQVR